MFVLHRRGGFTPTKSTSNQCKQVGHSYYNYHVMIVTDLLDEEGFIIDHEVVDASIKKARLNGSCEEICHKMFLGIQKLPFKGNFVAYKCILSPTIPNQAAYMEYKWFNPNVKGADIYMASL